MSKFEHKSTARNAFLFYSVYIYYKHVLMYYCTLNHMFGVLCSGICYKNIRASGNYSLDVHDSCTCTCTKVCLLYTFQEEILQCLGQVIEKARDEFPRLYFLGDHEVTELLGISRKPQALMPFACKCFHGIENLTYSLPSIPGAQFKSSALDFKLHGRRDLQCTFDEIWLVFLCLLCIMGAGTLWS